MKKIIHLVIFMGLIIPLTAFSTAKEVIIAADVWCPYNCEPGSDKPGYLVEIVRESFKLFGNGEKIIYKKVPWTRAMLEAQKGNLSGIIGATLSESKGLHPPKEALGRYAAEFFTHKNNKFKFLNFTLII